MNASTSAATIVEISGVACGMRSGPRALSCNRNDAGGPERMQAFGWRVPRPRALQRQAIALTTTPKWEAL